LAPTKKSSENFDMKIGIIGTRGIPNQHGGFEQFAQFVSPNLVSRGHDVSVYNSSLHSYKASIWQGVNLIVQPDPEKSLGAAGQFIYDFNCILDSRKRNFDVILQLGYTSSSVWSILFPKKAVIVTNMDGLEWKRTKYSRQVQRFLLRAERWAVMNSNELIADSKGIQRYVYSKYKKRSVFIPYGATPFTEPNEDILKEYKLSKGTYNLLIARMEPENNIELILEGHRLSQHRKKLILIGKYENSFGSYLKQKYADENTLFWGPEYDIELLNNLRYHSHIYFHGHSVGGTNPSLLEAMASQALIAAHDNIFNRSVLEKDAFYFRTSTDVKKILDNKPEKPAYQTYIRNNNHKIIENYSWEHITDQLEKCLIAALYGKSK
jgi:glycosyltransferase involved in cell wall biosynthesis